MDLELLSVVLGYPAIFVAGVLVHKYVISEAAGIKAHVTTEVEEVRADIASLLSKVAAKV